jgi:hypothetical protein
MVFRGSMASGSRRREGMSARAHLGRAHPAALATVLVAVVAASCGEAGDEPRAPAPRRERAEAPPAQESPAARSAQRGPAWTQEAVLRRIAGRRVRVEGRSLRIDRATVTCGGLGRSVRSGGKRAWLRFECIQPTFPPGSVVGPDAIFKVTPTGRRSFLASDGRFTSY